LDADAVLEPLENLHRRARRIGEKFRAGAEVEAMHRRNAVRLQVTQRWSPVPASRVHAVVEAVVGAEVEDTPPMLVSRPEVLVAVQIGGEISKLVRRADQNRARMED